MISDKRDSPLKRPENYGVDTKVSKKEYFVLWSIMIEAKFYDSAVSLFYTLRPHRDQNTRL